MFDINQGGQLPLNQERVGEYNIFLINKSGEIKLKISLSVHSICEMSKKMLRARYIWLYFWQIWVG